MHTDTLDVVIFCGGRGTRLMERTRNTPKPLVEIGDQPILWHIMKIYNFYGHKRFILPLGFKGEMIKEYFLSYAWKNRDFELDLSKPELPTNNEGWQIAFKNTGIIVKERGLSRYFKGVYGIPALKYEIIEHILNEGGIKKEKAIFLGDEFSDEYAKKKLVCRLLPDLMVLIHQIQFKARCLRLPMITPGLSRNT